MRDRFYLPPVPIFARQHLPAKTGLAHARWAVNIKPDLAVELPRHHKPVKFLFALGSALSPFQRLAKFFRAKFLPLPASILFLLQMCFGSRDLMRPIHAMIVRCVGCGLADRAIDPL